MSDQQISCLRSSIGKPNSVASICARQALSKLLHPIESLAARKLVEDEAGALPDHRLHVLEVRAA